ncbi:Transcriptional regulator, LysR family [Marinobacterium lacunae]|uniref:Transcriptional regulator, LysR family n=1 Tax=Marinobacterium lacunae TaxID=1232683 RepID=A0A081G4R1_9GAMM|nr:LysR substrate-binding domain-containing protein [Marinobacterium lacunae]KEA65766.1 Transcriptional regulator, LysR family [Marinobacterium lacunae]MBR9884337.1 LysR family transcriptional regulator [Oceanospirillales bacterium]
MRKATLDLEALRSFVTGVELGNFASAAQSLNRSTSAVSAHLKKLEEQIGQPILQRSGRNLALLPTGERLLSYARQLLATNDEAIMALRQASLNGQVRLGLQEDFGEQVLTQTLGRFKRAYPGVQIEVVVARNAELVSGIRQGRLDLALAWDDGSPLPQTLALGAVPLYWIGARDHAEQLQRPLPLILFEAPCLVRQHVLEALDSAGIPWQITMTSRSLAGIWAAVQAGLGITVRTTIGMPNTLQSLNSAQGLPPLPNLNLVLHRLDSVRSPAVQALESCLLDALEHTQMLTQD